MIRKAEWKDLEQILKIYAHARKFMEESGNPTQWGTAYPPQNLIQKDIEREQLYIISENEQPHGVFMFAVGEDPAYRRIENGAWLSEEEYGVIHRIAGDGEIHGLLQQAVRYCSQKICHLRMDTHRDNKVMQYTLEKNGFIRCGIVYMEDGAERIAYECV